MTAKGYLRGHEIYWDGGQFRYCDNDMPTVGEWRDRPCGHCGLTATKEGHDGCLGTLPGAINACCGHGIEGEAYIQWRDGSDIRGAEALERQGQLIREADL